MTLSPSKTNALLCRLAMSGIISSVGLTGLGVLTAMSVTPAIAQEAKPEIQASTQIHKVVVVAGKDTYVTTPVIGLDDVVQYTMDYHNSTDAALSNVQVTFKVPKDMRYVGSSMTPAPTHAKVVGDKEWKKYPVLEFVSGRPQEVSPQSYDAFAWTIPMLEGKKTARVVLRTKLVQRPYIQ